MRSIVEVVDGCILHVLDSAEASVLFAQARPSTQTRYAGALGTHWGSSSSI